MESNAACPNPRTVGDPNGPRADSIKSPGTKEPAFAALSGFHATSSNIDMVPKAGLEPARAKLTTPSR